MINPLFEFDTPIQKSVNTCIWLEIEIYPQTLLSLKLHFWIIIIMNVRNYEHK